MVANLIGQYVRGAVTVIILISLMACAGAGQSGTNSGAKRLAVVNGETVTEEQIRKAAATDLENLELRKIQSDVGFSRDEQSIMEKALSTVIDDKVVQAEAKKRAVTTDALLQSEVDSKVPAPTEKEVADFYETNKARISIAKEEALRQIRVYLTDQKRDTVYQEFVNKLRKDYSVESFIEPQRMQVATQGFPTKGPATAAVTIVEFSDFECPYCATLFPTLKQVEAKYGDRIRVVFRQFPLTAIHPHAQKAAEASLCAAEQQKFWELHDAMFQDQRNLGVDALKQKASKLQLDTAKFDACLDSGKQAAAVKKDVFEGVRAGVTGTPAMFINGRFLNGAVPYPDVVKVIDEELQRSQKK